MDNRRRVDLLVVSANTTPGLRRDLRDLLDALHRTGLTVEVATSNYGLLSHLRHLAAPADDLIVAAGIRNAVRRAMNRCAPRSVMLTTSVAGGLLSTQLLQSAAVRIDGTASASRVRGRDVSARLLERRSLRNARVILPYSDRVRDDAAPLAGSQAIWVIWPSPVRAGPPQPSERLTGGLCYANNPHKKGLDLAVQAWTLAGSRSAPLFVTGISASVGRRFLAKRGISAPPNVEWLGHLSESEYRRLSARVLLYVGSSRVDEFATTQLEALMDGALLVTVPSQGPLEALHLAAALDRRMVASGVSAEALAVAIDHALSLPGTERADYRGRAQKLMSRYSTHAFDQCLKDEIVPALGLAQHEQEARDGEGRGTGIQ